MSRPFFSILIANKTEQADPYYWETGGNANLDWWGKVRHNLHFGGVKAIAAAESIGEVSNQFSDDVAENALLARVWRCSKSRGSGQEFFKSHGPGLFHASQNRRVAAAQ